MDGGKGASAKGENESQPPVVTKGVARPILESRLTNAGPLSLASRRPHPTAVYLDRTHLEIQFCPVINLQWLVQGPQ